MWADNLASEGHRKGDRQTAARRLTEAGQFGAGSVNLLEDPDGMLIELAAVMGQAKRFAAAHKKLQPDILLKARNSAADR